MSYRSDLKAKAEAGDKEAAKKFEKLVIRERESKRLSRARIKDKAKKGDKKAIKSLETERKNNRKAVRKYWDNWNKKINDGDAEAIAKREAYNASHQVDRALYAIKNVATLSELQELKKAIQHRREQLAK